MRCFSVVLLGLGIFLSAPSCAFLFSVPSSNSRRANQHHPVAPDTSNARSWRAPPQQHQQWKHRKHETPLFVMRSSTQAMKRPPLPENFYEENLLDKVALSLFRLLVQKEIGFKSDKGGYAGLIEEAQNYMVTQGASAKDQQDMVVRVLSTIAGPAVPPVYNTFMAPWPWAPLLTAFFTPPFFKFLVGPNKLDLRSDGTLGGVSVERCRFLEETDCKGLCTNMCKLPTEAFFQDTLGLPMSMDPDFDTYECRLSFGLRPRDLEQDEAFPRGCLTGCSCKAMGAEVSSTCAKQ